LENQASLSRLHNSFIAINDKNTPNSDNGEVVARAAEHNLHVDNDIFRRLVEGVREYAIFFLDPKGIVTTWNEGAQAIKGYTRDEIVGQHFSKFTSPKRSKAAGRSEN
jgi:PAS domain-containing protein